MVAKHNMDADHVQSRKPQLLAAGASATAAAGSASGGQNTNHVEGSGTPIRPVKAVRVDVKNFHIESLGGCGSSICQVIGPLGDGQQRVACPVLAARTTEPPTPSADEPEDSVSPQESEEATDERIPVDVERKIMESVNREAEIFHFLKRVFYFFHCVFVYYNV
jgi:hypothetical protein